MQQSGKEIEFESHEENVHRENKRPIEQEIMSYHGGYYDDHNKGIQYSSQENIFNTNYYNQYY